MSTNPFFFALFSVLLIVSVSSIHGFPQLDVVPKEPAGINQLVENRNGIISCWGVVIRLGNERFKDEIDEDQIEIREGKHGHDIKGIMEWKTSSDGKSITIRFKQGMGDFGSGNSVEIRIKRSAFKEPMYSRNEHYSWAINTDVL